MPEYGKTMAQLPPEHKNAISHRAAAARAARAVLQRWHTEGHL
ncbi:MAG: non-canonical purine NTP pyrophosphatase [Spirochaetota bacterium]